ncbi:CGNR zinc finger [Streptomyces sp. YIM 121038]|nr:CGNR zinc finger [Streptomyces sp. YIM 121038]
MLITHDTRCALDAVVDLVNSAPDDPDDEGGGNAEGLADVAALHAFVRNHSISDVGALTERDLAAVHRVRSRFAEVFAATEAHLAASLLNELVAAAGTTPRLTDHDGYDWHVHYFAPGASVADHLAADCGMALAFFVVAGEQERLRRCEAPDCRRAFIDLSRNRSRRYCDSRTCGNRLHVAAYRARRREAAGQEQGAPEDGGPGQGELEREHLEREPLGRGLQQEQVVQ